MKKRILDSLKIFALHAAAHLVRFLHRAAQYVGLWAKPTGRIIGRIYIAALHPVVLIIYSWYVKGVLSLQKRGITHRHPLLFLISRDRGPYGVLLTAFIIVLGHTAYLNNANAQEFFVPHNAVSRIFFTSNEFTIVKEESSQAPAEEYLDQIGERTLPTPNEEEQEAQPSPDSGTIAAIPDALIKPIVPTLQKKPYKTMSIQTYSVRGGDTLGGIARAYGIKLITLLSSNNLSERSTIREGQKLIILPVDGIQYRVRRGDTLAKIAQEYQSTVSKIMGANRRENPNDIAIGELLIIPDGVAKRPTIVRQSTQRGLISRIRNAIVPAPSQSRSARGLFIWPTSASRITQYFSWRHTGVDIAGPPSNRIYAAGDGRVIFAGWARGYGLSVVVDHGNGLKTRYGHSRLLYVKVGEYVSQGQTIAMVGNTGRSTGPHVHFEVIKSNIRVNPFGYIR